MVRSTDAHVGQVARYGSGGQTVQSVPAPASTIDDESRRNDGGRSQELLLFIRGNAMSGAPIISGTNQFLNPPIIIGITIKKLLQMHGQ